MAKALTATVTRAFHLRTGVIAESVSPAAYRDYIRGLAFDSRHRCQRPR